MRNTKAKATTAATAAARSIYKCYAVIPPNSFRLNVSLLFQLLIAPAEQLHRGREMAFKGASLRVESTPRLTAEIFKNEEANKFASNFASAIFPRLIPLSRRDQQIWARRELSSTKDFGGERLSKADKRARRRRLN